MIRTMTSGLRLGLKKSDRNYILQKKNAERLNNKRSSKADQEKVGTGRWLPGSSSVIFIVLIGAQVKESKSTILGKFTG